MTRLVCIATYLSLNRVNCRQSQATDISPRLRRTEAGAWFREDRNFVLRILRPENFGAFVVCAPVGPRSVGRPVGTRSSSSNRARITHRAILFELTSTRANRTCGLL